MKKKCDCLEKKKYFPKGQSDCVMLWEGHMKTRG